MAGSDPKAAVGPVLGAMIAAFGSGPSAYNPGDTTYRPADYNSGDVGAVLANYTPLKTQTAAQTNRIVAQQNAFISNAIIQNGRTLRSTSDMIVQGGAARSQATTNAIENYDQKAVRGSGTFTNPDTGTTFYNVDTTQPYHFVDNSNGVHNSNTAIAPAGSNWHPLQQVPPGQ